MITSNHDNWHLSIANHVPGSVQRKHLACSVIFNPCNTPRGHYVQFLDQKIMAEMGRNSSQVTRVFSSRGRM